MAIRRLALTNQNLFGHATAKPGGHHPTVSNRLTEAATTIAECASENPDAGTEARMP